MSTTSGNAQMMGNGPANEPEKTLFGHPHGLYMLFFTELWERFSFYSMRGILTLYTAGVVLATMSQQAAGREADQVYGAYLGFVYSTPLIGGMLADRLIGQRRAINIGGILMALGQFALATHAYLWYQKTPINELSWLFFTGLGLLSAGNGLFKPNISAIVGQLYRQGDSRRDAAFTIFYMGINIGAFLASFSGQLAQSKGWYLGFLLAGIGMLIGQVIFYVGRHTIGESGRAPANANQWGPGRFGIPNVLVMAIGIVVFIPIAAYMMAHPKYVQSLAVIVALPVLAYLIWEAMRGTKEEAGRMFVILVLCAFSMVFWGFFELAGSTVTRFTDVAVNRVVMGHELQASFLANVVNPLVIIVLSIPVAGVWVWLDRKRLEPSSPLKFVLGLAQLSASFAVLYIGALEARNGGKSALTWLILAFILQSTGELCLSPVGLSTITKLSPARLVGMFMGVWFLASALGNILVPLITTVDEHADFADVFKLIAIITAVGAVVLLFLVKPLKKMMHGVK